MSRPPSELISQNLRDLAHSLESLNAVVEIYRNLTGTPESEHLLGAMRAIGLSMSGQVDTLNTLLKKQQIAYVASDSFRDRLHVLNSSR